jgi:tetratricopeptide (TPR) repeat protein
MDLLKRPLISHLLCLAFGLGAGLFLARPNNPASSPVVFPDNIPAATGTATEPSAMDAATLRQLPDKQTLDTTSGLIQLREDYFEQFRRGETRQALLILQEMEKKGPKTQIYLETNSEYLVQMKEWRAAASAAQSCVALFPQSRPCYRNLATAEIQDGTSTDQVTAVDNCLKLEPNDPQCRNILGLVQMNSGDYTNAVATFEKLIRDNGSYGVRFADDHLEWQLGLALEGAGRPEEAIDHLENACRRNNNQACKKIDEITGGGIN